MSVDGFIADENDEVGPLFDWYSAGPVEIATAGAERNLSVDEESAQALKEMVGRIRALICGRRLFEIAKGWGGMHPVGCPVIVVSHGTPAGWPIEGAPFHLAHDLETAVALAEQLAGDEIVAVATPTITQQLLNAGRLDVLRVNIAPVLLGKGIPWFAHLEHAPLLLDDPEVSAGTRVTHLTYRVRRSGAR